MLEIRLIEIETWNRWHGVGLTWNVHRDWWHRIWLTGSVGWNWGHRIRLSRPVWWYRWHRIRLTGPVGRGLVHLRRVWLTLWLNVHLLLQLLICLPCIHSRGLVVYFVLFLLLFAYFLPLILSNRFRHLLLLRFRLLSFLQILYGFLDLRSLGFWLLEVACRVLLHHENGLSLDDFLLRARRLIAAQYCKALINWLLVIILLWCR